MEPTSGPADVGEQWPISSTRDLHRDDWVMALREDRIRRPGHRDDEPFRRLVLEHPGAVVVLALDEQDRVCVITQYRHPAQRRFVELPAGLMDAGDEEPVEVAARELQEEVGLAAAEWTSLGAIHPSPGISAEVQHLFVARGLTDVGHGDFELEHEEAEIVQSWVPFTEVYDAVLDNRVQDAPLVAAVLLARARGLVGPPAQD